jgi:hypothetical protein
MEPSKGKTIMNHPLHLNELLTTPTASLELTKVALAAPFINDSLACVTVVDAVGLRVEHLHPGEPFRFDGRSGFLASVDASDPSSPVCVFHLD